MARPRKDNPLVNVSLRLTPDTVARIRQYGSPTQVIRRAIDTWLQAVEPGPTAASDDEAVVNLVRRLEPEYSGLVPIETLRQRLPGLDVDSTILRLEGAYLLDGKIANDRRTAPPGIDIPGRGLVCWACYRGGT